jgi:hypothetical protein
LRKLAETDHIGRLAVKRRMRSALVVKKKVAPRDPPGIGRKLRFPRKVVYAYLEKGDLFFQGPK